MNRRELQTLRARYKAAKGRKHARLRRWLRVYIHTVIAMKKARTMASLDHMFVKRTRGLSATLSATLSGSPSP
jgi:hypothetical protein